MLVLTVEPNVMTLVSILLSGQHSQGTVQNVASLLAFLLIRFIAVSCLQSCLGAARARPKEQSVMAGTGKAGWGAACFVPQFENE